MDFDFNSATALVPTWLPPPVETCIGTLTYEELDLLQHYKTNVWHTFAVRDNSIVHTVLRDYLPQLSIDQPHLLYALLSTAISHRNKMQSSRQSENQALVYRHKTFEMYTKALQSITADNYEGIVATSAFLLNLIPPPREESDQEQLDWMSSLLKMSEGLRVLASLRWAQGIETLPIYPLICRELRTLPPPPLIDINLDAPIGPLGSTPDNPNPASTYRFRQPHSTRLFLPPSLMAILRAIIVPPSDGNLEFYAGQLKPVFHAFSPIFLSLYYFHLNPDFFVRVLVFTSFLMPDFLQLVKAREPRALVLMAWWLALASLVTTGWWVGTKTGNIIYAVGRAIRGRPDYWEQVGHSGSTMCLVEDALQRVEIIMGMRDAMGKEAAARCIFDAWPGVIWEEGPKRAEEWEFEQLLDLDSDLGSFMAATSLGVS